MTEHKKRCIFISHASEDEPIAAALHEFIKEACSDAIDCWFSSDKSASGGLKPGSQWFNDIHEHLKTASRVFTIVTPQSINHPWIYWESGIGAINCEGGVTPIVMGISLNELGSPLTHFGGINGLDAENLRVNIIKVAGEVGLQPPGRYLPDMCQRFIDTVRPLIEAQTVSKDGVLEDDQVVTKSDLDNFAKRFEDKLETLVGRAESPQAFPEHKAVDGETRKPNTEITNAARQAIELEQAGAEIDVHFIRALAGRLYEDGEFELVKTLMLYVTSRANSAATDFFNLGVTLNELGQTGEAEDAYRKAVEADPKHAAAWSNLGNLLDDLDRKKEAEEAYRKALEADPKCAAAWSNLGVLLKGTDRTEEAEKAYRKALEADPKDAAAWFNLGALLSHLDRKEEAEEAYRKAVECAGSPSDSAIYLNNLAYFLWGQSKFVEAEAEVRKALEMDDGNSYANATLGLLLFEKDSVKEGREYYLKALELKPDDMLLRQKFRLEYARALARNGRQAEARKELEKAKKTEAGYVTPEFIDSLLGRLDDTADWSIP